MRGICEYVPAKQSTPDDLSNVVVLCCLFKQHIYIYINVSAEVLTYTKVILCWCRRSDSYKKAAATQGV